MTTRQVLVARPWLDGTEHDKEARPSCLHYDLYAYRDAAGAYWFCLEARQGGKALLGRTVWRRGSDGLLYPMSASGVALHPVTWRGDHAPVLADVHARLLGQCVALPGFARVSVYAHYVQTPDADPWPVGMLNAYRYGTGAARKVATGNPRGRPRRDRVQSAPASPLPDIL